ncbi:MAG TPA: HIT domain-containing protein [Patescibacteria group bacterium]|jgi:diadenosine tetraphosphate (Ap4A) HIT family hydrolase|nr:HIT domain-containing protein [Patescibacteria group bacterium]
MQNSSVNCIFCKIIQGTIPATFIAQNDHALVIKDIAPKAPVHYLIIPKIHVPDMIHLTEDQYVIGSHLFALAHEVGSSLTDKPDFRLIINNGADAGQSVFHLHMHLLAGMKQAGF